ncbi:MAG: hypothetical protein MJ058_04230 [Akkermansia sp.]|nr:hypothetical protein [Akkermansia sp.]
MKIKLRLTGAVQDVKCGGKEYFLASVTAKAPEAKDGDGGFPIAIARFFDREEAEAFVQRQTAFLEVASGNSPN